MRCFKQLKAFKFFKDGHVQEISLSFISDKRGYCFVKSKVLPSMRQDRVYSTWVAIVKETGKVFSADCNCTAGYVSKVDFLLASSLISLSAGQLGQIQKLILFFSIQDSEDPLRELEVSEKALFSCSSSLQFVFQQFSYCHFASFLFHASKVVPFYLLFLACMLQCIVLHSS